MRFYYRKDVSQYGSNFSVFGQAIFSKRWRVSFFCYHFHTLQMSRKIIQNMVADETGNEYG
jgi:hypothetical protein